MKVYTKTGDDGTTSLFSGKRVSKHHTRIKAYGTIDELNAWIGLIRDQTEGKIQKELVQIQQLLMTIGSQLANDKSDLDFDGVSTNDVKMLETQIDKMTELLPSLKNFVIPGGHPLVSYTHLARCVCRRAERFITELNEKEPIEKEIIFFINRLSDYLFTLSRKFTYEMQVEEIKWQLDRK